MTYQCSLNEEILSLCTEISELLGQIGSNPSVKTDLALRRQSLLFKVHSSAAIEGNPLTLRQVNDLEHQTAADPLSKSQIEIVNAKAAYAASERWDPWSIKHFLSAHKTMMRNLMPAPGNFRTTNVGVWQGKKLNHQAPSAKYVSKLMSDLFQFLKAQKAALYLIKSAVCHYEIEFIHPFTDGNGRMGRLWQHLILVKQNPIFAVVPFESLIHANQKKYYQALRLSDRSGSNAAFVTFSLTTIRDALNQLSAQVRSKKLKDSDRLEVARQHFTKAWFSRKEYLLLFKDISSATASRDLSLATKTKILQSKGEKNATRYQFI